jgi:uncharacterized repeat protein (TIGR01451 family)
MVKGRWIAVCLLAAGMMGTGWIEPARAQQISVTKTSISGEGTDVVTPGGTVIYTVTITNENTPGGADANGTLVADPRPSGIASQSWTCTPSGTAICTANGAGDLNDVLTTFAVGDSVVYTITATVGATPPALITNTALVTPPVGGACATGEPNPPCTAAVSNAP